MKLDKTIVNGNTKALSANYTVEYSEEIEHVIGEELQREIDNEVINQIIGPTLIDEGWTYIEVSNHWDIPGNWAKENLKNEYKTFGRFWYFKNKADATMFSLRWK